VPLNSNILTGKSQNIIVQCLSGPFTKAIELVFNRELVVKEPAEVINGLALYAHALTEKGLTPFSIEQEVF